MKYRVEYAHRAQVDAIEAYEWIRQHSEEAANRWYAGLRNATDSLRELPLRCGIAPESHYFHTEIRCLHYGRYRILFRVMEDSVEIVHIRHGARRVLGEEVKDGDE